MPGSTLSHIPFNFGLAEGVDPHHVPPGTLTTAENVVWHKTGELRKRQGTSLLPAGPSSGQRLIPTPRTLSVLDDNALNNFSEVAGSWRQVRQVAQYSPTWASSVDTIFGLDAWDSVLVGSYEVVAWLSGAGGSAFVRVNDIDGATIIGPTPVESGINIIRLVADGSRAYLLMHKPGSTSILVRTITPSTATISAHSVLVTDAGPTIFGVEPYAFGACMSGVYLVLGYANFLAPAPLLLRKFDTTTWIQSGSTGGITSETNPVLGVDIDGRSSDAIYVLYSVDNDPFVTDVTVVKMATANATTLAQVNAPALVDSIVSNIDNPQLGVTWMSAGKALAVWKNADSPGDMAASIVYQSNAPDTTTTRGTSGFRWGSKPFPFDGRYFALAISRTISVANPTHTPRPSQPTTVLVEVETSTKPASDFCPHRRIGTIDILIGGSGSDQLAQGFGLSATSAVVYSPFQSTPDLLLSSSRQGLRRVVLQPRGSASDYGRPARCGPTDYLAVGCVSSWDDQNEIEVGFSHAPDIYSAIAGTGGGGHTMAAGDYLYSTVFEYRDANGILQRSEPSVPVKVTVGGTNSGFVTLGIHTACLDHHEPDLAAAASSGYVSVYIVVYRSTVGGSVLHRLVSSPANNPFVGSVTFVDGVPDGNIGTGVSLDSRPVLYTTGGILPERQPPSMRTLLSHKGRLWGISGDGQTVWFTKLYADDPTISPGWNEDFLFPFDATLTALGELDEKIVFFSETDIWYTVGDGPAANGSGSDYPQPIHIPSPIGCTNPRSVVETPNGLFFQSARGIYLLNRGLELEFVGRNVQDEVAAFPNITSAVLVQKKNQVRFTANNGNSTAGIVLVYDLITQQWSTSKYTNTATSTASTPFADACLRADGTWCFLTPGGRVFVEDDATYLDGGTTWVPITLETAWISGTGPIQYQTVRNFQLQGTSNTDHVLTISVGFDSTTAYQQIEVFPAKSKVTSIGPLEECKIVIGNRRKCKHIRFKIQDSSPGGGLVGNGQGPSLSTMGVTVGMRPNFTNLSPAKQG